MNDKKNDLLTRIIWVSALVSLLDIRQAGFLGIYVIFIAFIIMLYINISESPLDISIMSIINKTSQILATIMLLFFYIFFCIILYRKQIVEDQMPSSWYVFSYLIMIILVFHGYVIQQTLTTDKPYWCSIAMVGNVMLFVCIFIEYLAATYFRTDGFRV
jgi:hypothetical protein